MAHFKLELLTHVTDRIKSNFESYYLTSPIVNFDETVTNIQEKSNSLFKNIFSFDEKFSLHANAQKELTFSMTDKIFYEDQWIDNPYAHNMHVGSQLLLTDKYGHEYLMTVSKIDFQIQDLNITYKYTCQDSFSYQAMNQNQGYEIQNDINSPDFLGAHNLDFWMHKIVTECYNTYNDLRTDQGLYVDINNQLHVYESSDKLTEVKKIIKEPLIDDYFQQVFTFSCSNSNAVAALISLGEQLDCIIHTYEYSYRELQDRKLKLKKYFWFEPKKRAISTGLKYTPNIDLQSFNFSLNGSNLATILNITPNHIGDEIISLFPTVPAFFQTWFQSKEWEDSKYTYNMFSQKLAGINETYEGQLTKNRITEDQLTLYDITKFIQKYKLLRSEYPFINFNQEKNYSTINNTASIETIFYLFIPYWVIKDNVGTLHYLKIKDHDRIPNWWFANQIKYADEIQSNNGRIFLGIGSITQDTVFSKIFFSCTRERDQDEIAFAEIADKCPWLENKLINLDYALSQKLISTDEYKDIYNFLNNDIRVLNGQLMAYSQSYYLELHKSVQTISRYTAMIDKVGAIINDLINDYAEKATVNEKVLDNFDVEYSKMFKTNLSEVEEPHFLINYDSLVSDYYNKTFDANQRFFKHIKHFRDYFESYDNFTNNDDTRYLTNYTLSINYDNSPSDNSHDVYYYSFQANDFETIYQVNADETIEFKSLVNDVAKIEHTDLYFNTRNGYHKLPLATMANIKNIYKLKEEKITPLTNTQYNENDDYFLTQEDYIQIISEEIPSERVKIENDTYYILLLPSEIKKVILSENTNSKYYFRKTNVYTPLDWLRYPVPNKEESFEALLNTTFEDKMPRPHFLEDVKLNSLDYYHLYASSFPLDYIYYLGPRYIIKNNDPNNIRPFIVERQNELGYNKETWQEKITKFIAENPTETELTVTQFGQNPDETILFQQIPFVSNIPVSANNLESLNIDDYLTNIEELTDSLIYYAPVYNSKAIQISKNTGIAAVVSLLFAPLILPLAITSIVYSQLARKKDNIQWLNKYIPNYLFEPTLEYNASDKKYIFMPTDYTFNGFYDSTKAIFAKTADAFSQMERNTLANYGKTNGGLITDLKEGALADKNKFFFNYYGLIAATYSFEYKDPKTSTGVIQAYDSNDKPAITNNTPNYRLWIKNNSYSRIMSLDDSIYRYDKYYLVLLDSTENSNINKTTWTIFKDGKQSRFSPWTDTTKIIDGKNDIDRKFSNIQYYWLPKILLDLSVIPSELWGDNNIINVRDLNLTAIDNSNFVFQKKVSNSTWTCLLVHDEPYETVAIGQETAHINWDQYTINYKEWNNEQLYSYQTHAPIDLLNEALPVSKLFVLTHYQKEDAYKLITQKELKNNNNLHFYYKDVKDNRYYRTYSPQQILNSIQNAEKTDLLPLYFHNNQYQQLTLLERNRKKFLVNVYAHHIQYNQDNSKIIKDEKEVFYNQELDFTNSSTIDFYINDPDDKYKTQIHLSSEIGYTFQPMSNGEIWYNFHDSQLSSSLIEQANVVEVQLDEAWTQAVLASKMGNYFIPDSWKPSTNEQKNSWTDQIWNIGQKTQSSNTFTPVHLSSNILPEVSIYKTRYQDKITDQLPKYHFIHNPDVEELDSLVSINNENINVHPSFKLHRILNPFTYDQDNQWYVKEEGLTTYYYLADVNQGILWRNLLSNTLLASSNKQVKTIYEHFDGWNPMMYHILESRFKQSDKPKFITLQESKLQKWSSLYKAYPNVFLEKTYTNTDATTSKEMMQMAELAFKDQLKPEEAYNLTVIDIASIKGYNGQELRIGDSIQLDVDTLYSNFDDIYNSLTKFLFITDISYDLRKDTDIQLTVNTIKYQEKLLQQLVKLIR